MRSMMVVALSALVLSAFGVTGDWRAPSRDPVLSAPGAIDTKVGGTWCGHVQGMCATSNALYFALHNQIVKTDWLGRLVKRIELPPHCGDICVWKGRLYASVWLAPKEKDGKYRAWIYVFDAGTLELQKTRDIGWEGGMDGITCLDGVLYVSLGMENWKSSGHRNMFGKFDAETLDPIGAPFVVDHGEDSSCGVQNFTNDGTYFYASYYTLDEAAKTPCLIVFDREFKVVGKHCFGHQQGLDVIPGGRDGAVRFAYCTTINWNWKHRFADPPIPVQALVQFAELKDGKIEDISRHCMFKKPIK